MKLLLLLTGLSATAAITLEPVILDDGFSFTENALPPDVLASLQAKIKGGSVGVEASSALAEIFGVTAGAFVPGKVASGPVAEHQDRFADGGAVTRVNVLYLDVGGVKGPKLPKFTLRDMRTGVERWMQLKPNLLVSYENEFFTHRVDADESSKRFMLGPTSLHKDGVLAPVGDAEICEEPSLVNAPAEWDAYRCPRYGPPGVGDIAAEYETNAGPCCSLTNGEPTADTPACIGESICVPLEVTPILDDRRLRRLTFGAFKVEPKIGCCYCPNGRAWNSFAEVCCEEGEEVCNTSGGCVQAGTCPLLEKRRQVLFGPE